jgi:hypothetical protein
VAPARSRGGAGRRQPRALQHPIGRRGPNNTRHREVLRTLGTRLGRLGGGGTSYNSELAVGAPMAGRQSQWGRLTWMREGGTVAVL